MTFFPYDISPKARPFLRLLGVRPDRDGVRISGDRLAASYGFLNLDVPLTNVASATVTGPYRWFKALGPRLSMADHGLTFGTTTARGVCLTFATPVPSVFGPWDHPGFTVTVSDPEALVTLIEASQP